METASAKQLRQLIDQYFNLDEIQLLCTDLGIDHDHIPGAEKQTKIDQLLRYIMRRKRQSELIAELREKRPDVDWSDTYFLQEKENQSDVLDAVEWQKNLTKYLINLKKQVGFVRVLGRMEAYSLENVFTHVNILDKPSAEQRYSINELQDEFSPRDFDRLDRTKRVAGDEAVAEHDKLFILGKPGAGKTTFLKYTALRAINQDINKVPIFVTLKELSDSGMEIIPFIIHQFKIHRFPKPEVFVEQILKVGNALVLFDGLDEVNLEDSKRANLIRALNDFVYQCSDCHILITCRVATSDYSFPQFKYIEMADFDEGQIGRYIDAWFANDEVKRKNCRLVLLENKENEAVRELAQVPLLLAMLCLVFEEWGKFPPNLDEIYDEATRALLVKWDSSRNILRDSMYKQLSLKHKQKMLAYIAAITFVEGEYFLPEKRLVNLIETYLQGVPGLEDPDGDWVLKTMEAQHGIFVERAWQIHSFSHLTLQEYFTARYLVDNEQRRMIKVIQNVGNDRWREVFKLATGMLDDATGFFLQYLEAVTLLLKSDPQLLAILCWAKDKNIKRTKVFTPPAVRAFLLYRTFAVAKVIALSGGHSQSGDLESVCANSLTLARALDISLALAHALSLIRDRYLARDLSLQVAEQLDLTDFKKDLEELLMSEGENDLSTMYHFARTFSAVQDKYQENWDPSLQIYGTNAEAELLAKLSKEQCGTFIRYLKANTLLVECLQVAYVPDREAIENQILLPPPTA